MGYAQPILSIANIALNLVRIALELLRRRRPSRRRPLRPRAAGRRLLTA